MSADKELPGPRSAHGRSASALTKAGGTDPERLVLIEATDRLTDSIDFLATVLGQYLAGHVPAPVRAPS